MIFNGAQKKAGKTVVKFLPAIKLLIYFMPDMSERFRNGESTFH